MQWCYSCSPLTADPVRYTHSYNILLPLAPQSIEEFLRMLFACTWVLVSVKLNMNIKHCVFFLCASVFYWLEAKADDYWDVLCIVCIEGWTWYSYITGLFLSAFGGKDETHWTTIPSWTSVMLLIFTSDSWPCLWFWTCSMSCFKLCALGRYCLKHVSKAPEVDIFGSWNCMEW